MNSEVFWRPARWDDIDAVMAIQDEVHSMLPERREIFIDKMWASPGSCLILVSPSGALGYGVAHPWRLDDAPALDTVLGPMPSPDCFFIHDVALRPEARGQGAAKAFVERMVSLARARHFAALSLISVYGTVPVWEKLGFALRPEGVPAHKLAAYGSSARYMVAMLPEDRPDTAR